MGQQLIDSPYTHGMLVVAVAWGAWAARGTLPHLGAWIRRRLSRLGAWLCDHGALVQCGRLTVVWKAPSSQNYADQAGGRVSPALAQPTSLSVDTDTLTALPAPVADRSGSTRVRSRRRKQGARLPRTGAA